MSIEIRETTISPDGKGTVVRISISDKPPPFESATMLLQMTVRLPEYETPLLAHVQREAVTEADRVLRDLYRNLGEEIGKNQPHLDLRPRERPASPRPMRPRND
jgi:hypothetical protein